MRRRRRVALVSMRLINGETFAAIRRERGKSQSDIARSVGVTPSFVSQLESGKKGCTAETAAAIVKALGAPKYGVRQLFVNTVQPIEGSPSTSRRSQRALLKSA